SGAGSWLTMVDTARKIVHSKLPVSPGMYRSLHKRDYGCCEECKPPSEEDVQVPRAFPCLALHADDTGGRKAEGRTSSPKALRKRKNFTSVLPAAESYLPKCYPATELAATQAEKSERPPALAEPESELSSCQRLPTAAQTGGNGLTLLHRQKLAPSWATYQQFTLETCRARQHDAQQNRSMILDSYLASLSLECFDLDWRSTYNRDFQRSPGADGGHCRANKSLSHIFPEDVRLNQ
ncbi:hypothetical protein N306_07601, partial [Opisthocomus hoazin]